MLLLLHHATTATGPTGLVGRRCRHSTEHRMVQVIVERRRRVSHERIGRTTDVLMQRKMGLLLLLLLLMDVMLLETLLLRMLRIVLVRMLLMLVVVIVRGVTYILIITVVTVSS